EWQLAEEVGALSHEDLVRLDVKDHVEVTRGSSEEAAFSLAAEAELIAVFHAGRDGDLEQPLPSNARLAAAVLARRAVDLTLAAALGAGAGHGEKALGEAHLARAPAGAAGLGLGAGLLSGALAAFAAFQARDLELGLEALGRLLERHLEVVAQMLAPPRARAAPAPPKKPSKRSSKMVPKPASWPLPAPLTVPKRSYWARRSGSDSTA